MARVGEFEKFACVGVGKFIGVGEVEKSVAK